jgi:putative oxidoreductase
MYSRLMKWAEILGPVGYFLLRLAIGYIFLRTGYGKWQNLENTISYFRSLHVPAPTVQAPLVATVELLGGLALILGVFARPAALLLSGVMAVALVTAIWPAEQSKIEVFLSDEMIYLLILWIFVGHGSGKWALKSGS